MKSILLAVLLCLLPIHISAQFPPETPRFTVESDDNDSSVFIAKSPNTSINFRSHIYIWGSSWYTGGASYATLDTTDVPVDGDVLTWSTGDILDWQPGSADGNDTLWSLQTNRDSLIYIFADGDTLRIFDLGDTTVIRTTDNVLRFGSNAANIELDGGGSINEVGAIFGQKTGQALWLSALGGGDTRLNIANELGSKTVIYDSLTPKWTFDTDTLKGDDGTQVIFDIQSVTADSGLFGDVISTGAGSGTLTLSGATSGSAAITVADVAGTPSELVLPTTDGSNGDQLTTDGAGITSWQAPGGTGWDWSDSSSHGPDSVTYADSALVWSADVDTGGTDIAAALAARVDTAAHHDTADVIRAEIRDTATAVWNDSASVIRATILDTADVVAVIEDSIATMSLDSVFVGVSPLKEAVFGATTTKPGYCFQEPDAHFGNATAGMISIGDAFIAHGTRDTTYNNDSLDLGGTMVFRQSVAVDEWFEFVFFENSGDIRFVIPKSGVGLGTYNSRSMFIAGPARLHDSVVHKDFWGFTKIDANTSATGADLGVQDDAEIKGIVYLDTIDNITAAPIEVLADLELNSNDITGADSVDIIKYTDGSIDLPDLADDVIDTSKMADTDHGDVSWSSGVASVEGGFSDSTGAASINNIQVNLTGSPVLDRLDDYINVFASAGDQDDSDIRDTTDGAGNTDSIYVAAGSGYLRISDDHNVQLTAVDWGDTTIAVVDGAFIYVGVEYNSGSPKVFSTSTIGDLNYHTNFDLGTVANESGVLHIDLSSHLVANSSGHMITRISEVMGVERANSLGGVILGETGARNITVTAGSLWGKLNKFTILAINTSGADRFDRYYSDGGSDFTLEAAQAQWNNTQYDDGDGGLATLGNNKWGVQWFWIETDGNLVSMYGTVEHNSIAAAELETTPSNTPNRIQKQALLIGRLVFQESQSTAGSILSQFINGAQGSAVSDHGNLSGLSDDDHGQYLLRSNFTDSIGATGTQIGSAVAADSAGKTIDDVMNHTLDSAEVITIVDDSGLSITNGTEKTEINAGAGNDSLFVGTNDTYVQIGPSGTTEIESLLNLSDNDIDSVNVITLDTISGLAAGNINFADTAMFSFYVDMNSASALRLPNDANPNPTNASEIIADNDDDMLVMTDGSNDYVVAERYTAFIFSADNPSTLVNDTILIPIRFFAPGGIKIDSIGVITDASSSYSVEFEKWTNPDVGTGTETAFDTVATSTSFEAYKGGVATTIALGEYIAVLLPDDSVGRVTVLIGYEKLGND